MSQATTTDTIRDFIYAELVDLGVEEQSIVETAKFDELDIDSLDVADLMMSIKKDFGADIPRRDLIGMTLAELVNRVATAQS